MARTALPAVDCGAPAGVLRPPWSRLEERLRQEDHLQAMTPPGGWSAQAMIKRLENAEEELLKCHEELRDITLRAHIDRHG